MLTLAHFCQWGHQTNFHGHQFCQPSSSQSTDLSCQTLRSQEDAKALNSTYKTYQKLGENIKSGSKNEGEQSREKEEKEEEEDDEVRVVGGEKRRKKKRGREEEEEGRMRKRKERHVEEGAILSKAIVKR